MADDIRHGRFWLLAAQLATIAPQWDRLPWWLTALAVVACVWRIPRVETSLPPPGFAARVLILIAGMVGLFKAYHSLIGPEAGTAFLVLCMAAKLLEMRNRRDCHVVVILGFFVVATNFLFGQSLLLTLYIGGVLVLIAGSLLVMHQPSDRRAPETAKQALLLVGQALPLMIILFVFFPRLPPLWTMHLSKGGATTTGMSDTVTPGDIAQLSQSDALAFRVEFSSPMPAKADLYWRGLVLSRFDGTSWRQAPELSEGSMVSWPQDSGMPRWIYQIRVDHTTSVSYKVTLEPTDQTWLFALTLPYSATEGVGFTRELNLQAAQPVTSRKVYEVRSFKTLALDPDLAGPMRDTYLSLPDGNPRTRELAVKWRRQAPSDMDYINGVMSWFHQQNFVYTLSPPPLSDDRIDEFLFTTRQGFCEHYASAFVFLMRAAGIPARMVVGYQGGQPSPRGDYWEVRQMDAHAWAEVWLPDRGWAQVDPTAAVAPERIKLGAQAMAQKRDFWGDSGASALRYSNFQMFRGLHEFLDDLNFRWSRNVLNYNSDSQDGLMTRLLGDADYLKRALVMAGLFAGVLGLLVLGWWWRQPRQREPEPDRYYRRYCQRMAEAGLPRQPGEGAADFANRIARERPKLAHSAAEVRMLYSRLRYQPPGSEQQAMLRRLRLLASTTPVKA